MVDYTLRVGRISSVNYEDGTARVVYSGMDDNTTVEVPFLDRGTYRPWKVNELCLIACVSGGPSREVIIGPYWHKGKDGKERYPKDGRKDFYRFELTNYIAGPGTEYDDAEKWLEFIACQVRVKLDEKNATITVEGPIHDTTVTLKTLKIIAGGCTIEMKDGAINIDAPNGITQTADIVAGAKKISHVNHTHMGVHGETSPPLP